MTTEFKVGQTVTFKSYHEPIKARVLEIKEGGFIFAYGKTEYRLEGISKPLTTITTGRSIMESELYVENTGNAFA